MIQQELQLHRVVVVRIFKSPVPRHKDDHFSRTYFSWEILFLGFEYK
jgi:hypothetical protein